MDETTDPASDTRNRETAGLTRRYGRRRAWLIAAVFGLTTLACESSTASEIERVEETAGGNDDVDARTADLATCLENPDAEASRTVTVWIEPGTNEQDIDAVEQIVATAQGVTDYTFVDEDESYAQFVEFFDGEPELIKLVEPGSLPPSFEIDLSELGRAEALVEQLSPMNAVESTHTVGATTSCDGEIEALADACGTNEDGLHEAAVWLEPGIQEAEIDRIERELADRSDVVAVRYVNQAETLEEFRQFYADEPDIADIADSDTLPTRFEISVDPVSPDGIVAMRTDLESLSPDVDSVEMALAAIACVGPS